MIVNGVFPYWYSPIVIPFCFNNLKRLDQNGIYMVDTNSVSLNTGVSVDYGIDEQEYNRLPCECIVLLKINSEVPTGGAALPITVQGSSPVKDSQGTSIKGKDILVQTERLAYLNKKKKVMRLLEYTAS